VKSLWKWAMLTIAAISAVSFVGSQAQQAGWQDPVVVASAGFAANNLVHNPDLAFDVSTGTLYVVYSDTRGDADIQLRSSKDGVNWTDPVNVSNTPGISLQPSVAARNGKVCVAWNEIVADTGLYAVYVACSTDGGQTFGAAQDVSNEPNDDAGKAEFFDSVADGSLGIAIDDQGVVHVAWTFYVEPKYSLSTDGKQFTEPITLPYQPSAAIGFPTFGVAPNGDLYLAWADRSGRSGDIFVIRSPAGANRTDPASWQGPFNATFNSGFSDGPWIAFQGGKIFIVNDDDTNNPSFADINLTVSSDNGQTWTGTRSIAKDGAFPSIAADSGTNLYVAFEAKGGTLGFVCSTDGGENWKRDDVNTRLVGEKRFQGVRNVDQRGIVTDTSGNVYVTYLTRPQANVSNIIVQKRVGC
jgi:hypothetical protein